METKKYIEQRKKLVTQLRSLITLRLQANKDIRKVRSEMDGWDSALIEGD